MDMFYLENYGCQMNKSDSNSLIHSLISEGFLETNDYEVSNYIIINTCSVRRHAEDRVFSRVKHFSSFKRKKNKSLKIIVMGCMAQTSKDKLESYGVDKVFDVYNEINILDYMKGYDVEYKKFNSNYIFNKSYKDKVYTHKAFIPITHGCSHWCTYCIVPHTRGHIVSRKYKDILDDVKRLAFAGVKEITLLGQNVNAYGKDIKEKTFEELLYSVNEITEKNDVWVRFLTSHPNDFNYNTAHAILSLKSICENIHLPFQSGSNRILKLMNRRYTIEEYLEKVAYLRDIKSDFSLSTDVIVGFALETDSEFNETLKVIENVLFEEAYMYKYSEREGTLAHKNKIKYDEAKGAQRLKKIIEVQRSIALKLLSKQVGLVTTVMIDGMAKDNVNYISKSRENRVIIVKPNGKKRYENGEIMSVKIEEIKGHTLISNEV